MNRPRSITLLIRVALATALALAAAACGEDSGSGGAVSTPTTSAASEQPQSLTVVSLGDSWPEGAHCGYCRTFAGLYADGIEASTNRPVEFVDLAAEAEPFWESMGGGTAGLLKALREDQAFQEQVASGDVIVIAMAQRDWTRARAVHARHMRRGG